MTHRGPFQPLLFCDRVEAVRSLRPGCRDRCLWASACAALCFEGVCPGRPGHGCRYFPSPLGGVSARWVKPFGWPQSLCPLLLQMSGWISEPAWSAGTGRRGCTMASSPARAARGSSRGASATSAFTDAAETRTASCHASSATGASTAGCSNASRWGWTEKVRKSGLL